MGQRKKFDKAFKEQVVIKILSGETIKKIHEKSHKIYGESQITKNLPANQKASKGRVARLMKVNGIRSKLIKRYKSTTNSKHNLPVAENILNRNFSAEKPNQKWVSDIVYIATKRLHSNFENKLDN